MLRDVLRLMLPLECAGCGQVDVVLCAGCKALIDGAPRRVEAAAPRLDRTGGPGTLPVWAVADYRGPVRETVLAWKDGGRADLDTVLGARLSSAARALAPTMASVVGREARLAVVPVPSSPWASLRRGRAPGTGLGREVAAGLRREGVAAQSAALLVARPAARDQVGLGQRARHRNVSGRMAVRRSAAQGHVMDAGTGVAGVLLVDDVLTTGATLAAADSALSSAGLSVLGALVLAATPAPGGTLVLPLRAVAG